MIGPAALVVAILAAAVGIVSSLRGSARDERVRVARLAAMTMAAAVVVATIRLILAIARLDFSLAYVAAQSRARSGGAYRLAALWGGAEGSLLLFAAMLAVVVVLATWRADAVRGRVVGCATVGVLAFTVLAFANPFALADLPAVRGAGLTPILEHPAMLYHPPILYAGLVATAPAFLGVFDSRHASDGHVATRVSWTLLTVGLATGANWAYVEVGWGGYWAWDPVENTVLIPWLLLTAALHLDRSDALRRRLPRLPAALAIAPFVFVMFGTAVTRSGGLSSVHAFADAEALGWMLGGLCLTLALLAGLQVLAIQGEPEHRPLDVSGGIGAASIVLPVFMTVVVFIGVGFPLLPGSERIVTPTYYNRIGLPVLLVTLAAMVLVPSIWRTRANPERVAGRRFWIGAAAGALGGVVGALLLGARSPLALTVAGLGGAVIATHLWTERRRVATVLGHVGLVVFALGVAGSAAATSERVVVAPGESITFGSDYVAHYLDYVVTDGPRPGSEAITLEFAIRTVGGDDVAELRPGLVSYPDRRLVLAETALHSTPMRDIQLVAQTVTDDGLASVTVAERPALMLVWWGSALIAAAGVATVVAKRQKAAPSVVGSVPPLSGQERVERRGRAGVVSVGRPGVTARRTRLR